MAADDDDDRELFERALESISPGDVFRAKYGQPAEADEQQDDDGERDDSEAGGAREELARLREQRKMEDAFADVEPMPDRDKYRRPEPKAPADLPGTSPEEFEKAMAAHSAPPAEQTAPASPSPTLAEQAADRAETINLRGLEPGEGVRKLGLFVDLASKDGHDFVHVKVGSDGELRAALREWFRGPGALYTLEFEVAEPEGDASIFARIRHQDRP